RQKLLVNIETGLTNPVSKYSIDQALNDVNAYYIAGSLPSAVSEITTSAGAVQSAASADVTALRQSKYQVQTTNTGKIISWLYPNGDETRKPDNAKLKKLINWMASYAPDTRLVQIPYVVFLHAADAKFEAERAQAIHDLNIP